MATDARGHTVPAASDHPSRAAILTAFLSVNDPVMVANTTARATLASTLGAAITSSRPLTVFRADSGTFETTTDGTTWSIIGRRIDSTYTPAWTSSGTAPALGNGTLVGNYSQDDKFVEFDVTLTIGSTTSVGSGNYLLSAPVAPIAGRHVINGFLLDISSGLLYTINGQIIGGGTTMNLYNGGFPVGALTAAAPVVPATGDIYRYAGRYRWA